MVLLHTIPPVYDQNSRILILGSFPSVKSREFGFFYGHPQNRFWRMLAMLFCCAIPQNIEDKRRMLLKNRVALWDVIASCEIEGSSDQSIKNAVPNDLSVIMSASDISAVFTNGNTADKLYRRFCLESTGLCARRMPSTSPANAAFSLQKLVEQWSAILEYLT